MFFLFFVFLFFFCFYFFFFFVFFLSIELFVLKYTASDYPFRIFKLLNFFYIKITEVQEVHVQQMMSVLQTVMVI